MLQLNLSPDTIKANCVEVHEAYLKHLHTQTQMLDIYHFKYLRYCIIPTFHPSNNLYNHILVLKKFRKI